MYIYLPLKGQMEPKISEANTQIFIFGWQESFLMGISWIIFYIYI